MRTEMGENVQEVVSRWLFEEEHVHTQTSQDLFCVSIGSLGLWNHDETRVYVVEQKNWLDKRFTTRCSVPSALRMFARVTKLWQAAYKKWLAKERERVTESFWESAVWRSWGCTGAPRTNSTHRRRRGWGTGWCSRGIARPRPKTRARRSSATCFDPSCQWCS